MNNEPGVYVIVAHQASIGITNSDKLVYKPVTGDTLFLGTSTKENIESLIYALERLKIHAK